MNEQVWWYATRAAGLMTWSAAVAAVIVGLMLSSRVIRARTGPWTLDLHRFLGGLTIVFLALHLVTLWADSYVEFGWREMLVPGASAWRPAAVAWGVLAAWILVAVEVTSLVRNRISQRVWRIVHWMSLLVVVMGTIHGHQAGSDAGNPLVWVAAVVGSVAIIALGAVRLQRRESTPSRADQQKTEAEILLEMRQRLADMPVPEARSRIEFVNEATTELPQRDDADDDELESAEDGSLLEALGRAVRVEHPDPQDPAAEPASTGSPFPADSHLGPSSPDDGDDLDAELGTWVAASPDDPFAAANRGDEPRAPQPFVEEAETSGQAPPAGETLPPPPSPLPMRPLRRVEPIRQPEEPAPMPSAADEPSLSPAPEAPSTPTDGSDSMVAVAPPPLPTTVDPATGEPDEEAYRAWLVEWLAYAEQYGDEAPVDPGRI